MANEKKSLTQLDLKINQAKKELIFKSALQAYIAIIRAFVITGLVLLIGTIFWCFGRNVFSQIAINFFSVLSDFQKDKILRESIKYYRTTKKLIKLQRQHSRI